MDIQRDEDFEKAYSEICKPIIARPYPRNEKGEYIYQEIHEAYLMWQAKAQAVPEGFVLVEKDTLNKALNPNDYDEAVCSANELLAVIEAQEQK